MRKGLIAILIVVALAGTPQWAAARVRALFVGIDHYQYSGDANQFADLQGSVNDAIGVRNALEATYHWGLDLAAPSACPDAPPSAATTSITLTDSCATHDAILRALVGLIAVSSPGDTVLFYYAGHGASIDDTAFNTKASGHYDTILAYDSRGPDDARYQKDIADRQLNVIIENALHVQGANVISIFDSCNSGTADRDPAHRGRSAPTVTVHRLPPLVETLQPANPALAAPGHRAHLAAAADDQLAAETAFPAPIGDHGLFTKALIDAIPATAGNALADILVAVQSALAKTGATQQPTGDGLLMTLNGATTAGVLIGAKAKAGKVRLEDGRLGNVTPGSTFALYPDWSSARLGTGVPLATGRVSAVTDSDATLTLDAPPAAPLPAAPVAREQVHAFANKVAVTLRLPDPSAIHAAKAALATIPFAEIAKTPEVIVGPDRAAKPRTILQTPDHAIFAHLPAATDPGFAKALGDALAPRARVDAMVALANAQGARELQLCISGAFFRHTAGFVCPDRRPGNEGLVKDHIVYMAIVNLASAARYITVFAITQDNSVTLLTLQDAPLPNQRPLTLELVPNTAGTMRFLVLATAQPINGAALEQAGGARDAGACTTALERLLCQANSGARDGAPARIDDWAGIVRTVTVGTGPAQTPSTGG